MIDFDSVVGFQWDAGNERKNELKHAVSKAEAEEVFFNAPLLLTEDARHSSAEPRFLALGTTHSGRRLTVIFTLREGGALIRIISARDQHRKERGLYDKAS
jgi:uncharacterized DUF497 family protein